MTKIQGYMGVLIHIPDDVHRRFRKEAKRKKMSLQDFGALIITAYLEVRKKKAPVLRKAGSKGISLGTPEPASPHRSVPVGWVLPQKKAV